MESTSNIALTKEYYRLFGKKSNLEANPFTIDSICEMGDCFSYECGFEGAIHFLEFETNRVLAKIKLCSQSERHLPIKERLNFVLVRLLLKLGRIHEYTRSLMTMKACVDKCLALNDPTSTLFDAATHVDLQIMLVKYHFLTDNKVEALRLMEAVVTFFTGRQ
jgi:hypothetical protein